MNIIVLAGGNSTERESIHCVRTGRMQGFKRA